MLRGPIFCPSKKKQSARKWAGPTHSSRANKTTIHLVARGAACSCAWWWAQIALPLLHPSVPWRSPPEASCALLPAGRFGSLLPMANRGSRLRKQWFPPAVTARPWSCRCSPSSPSRAHTVFVIVIAHRCALHCHCNPASGTV